MKVCKMKSANGILIKLTNFMRSFFWYKVWHKIGRQRVWPKIKVLWKLGTARIFCSCFWQFLRCCKNRISHVIFTLTCINGKNFTKILADIGSYRLIWGHLGLCNVIWPYSDSFKLIWGQLGLFELIWVKNLISFEANLFCLNLI